MWRSAFSYKVANELVASGLDVQVYVAGYAVDDPAITDQLACITEVTAGPTCRSAARSSSSLSSVRRPRSRTSSMTARKAETDRGIVGGELMSLPAKTYRVEVRTRIP